MPKFLAIAAVTLDGKIAKHSRHMSNWTSKEDKLFMRSVLDKCDVVIVGNNTYKTAIKPLSKRNCIVLSKRVSQSANQLVSKNLLYCNPRKANLKKLITKLKYKKIAILGGAQTYTYCLKNKMLDELYLTIEPLVFGKGINLFASPSSSEGRVGERLPDNKFQLLSVKKLNNNGSLLLHYKIKK